MAVMLPPPLRTRALVVGIEVYPGLGPSFEAPGAVAGAVTFAQWLINSRGVDRSAVEVWLSALDGRDPGEICAAAGLEGVAAHTFQWASFRDAVDDPQGVFAQGIVAENEFLMVYFCGHGVVWGSRNEQFLVLPEATAKQFHCFETGNWRELFKGSGWEHFRHQLWIIDACRNQWGDAMKPVRNEWNPGVAQGAYQCAMFACSTGEAASIDSKLGPRFTRDFLKATKTAPGVGWPAFEQILSDVAAQLRADTLGSQNPTLSIGEDWFGIPMINSHLRCERVRTLVSGIRWPFERFKPYFAKARGAPMQAGLPSPVDLNDAINVLDKMAPVAGIPPLLDFAERIARAADLADLRDWVNETLSPHQKAELQKRLSSGIGQARLALWYRDDGSQPCMEGDLDIVDAGSGIRPWQRIPAKPVTSETINQTVGQWLQAVFDHVGGQLVELIVELYLPRALLTTGAFDIATVPLDAANDLRLGEDQPALLRCTDRYKARTKLSRLRKHAPNILGRLVQLTGDPLRWAHAGEDAAALRTAFIASGTGGPVWLGFDPTVCGGEAPLDAALAEGLPAVVWLRAQASDNVMTQLRAGLARLLAGPLDQLPSQLVTWRMVQQEPAGRTLALLLDDPARVPAILTSWTQPGG
jgi:hypothetical protein